MNARETLALFVAGGNLRNAEPSPTMDPDTKKAVQQRLAAIREGGKVPAADSAPSEFRAAVAQREAAANAKAQERLDVPRWNAQHPVMKQVYAAHDAIASIPAPGGIGLLMLIIFIFFLVLIPITTGGPTRALLLWDVLLGQKTLPPITHNSVKIPTEPPPEKKPTLTPASDMQPSPNINLDAFANVDEVL